jgi:N-acyl-D-aspartate/D-glutamate deacylase
MHDLVIRGGDVVDGSGSAPEQKDVAIDGDRIVAVGPPGSVGAGRRELDARGKLVTPGFVDIHTHYDAQVTWDPQLTPSSWHGVTTVVMGNCGVGFAPVKADRHDWLIALMEGVEDIPGAAMAEGITWEWEGFPAYLDAIARKPHAIDFGCQVTHGALRAYVMGERGARNENATAEDLVAMRALVLEGLKAGALGFSTSRTLLHKAKDGEPVPGTFAAHDELFALGDALREAGHGVFQLAAEHLEAPTELVWMRELARRTGRTVSLNLNQTPWGLETWREVLAILDEAQAAGEPVVAQAAGRAIGVLMNWQTTAHPFAGCPSFQALLPLPWPERWARLKSPEFKRKLLAEEPLELGAFGDFVTRAFAQMYVAGSPIDYEPEPSSSLEARAEREQTTPLELAYEALCRDEGNGFLYLPLFNYGYGDLSLTRTLQQHPHVRMGLSDAGAHCGAICDGGMPTFMLTHWARDRTRGEKLTIGEVVHKQTRQTAELYGLRDRGLLRPGFKADVNVIDHGKLQLLEPRVAFDLPGGGRRLVQRARGYEATLVSGTVIVEHDQPTGALPGQLIRGPR